MRIPYIKIRQRSEIFYVTRFPAKELLSHVSYSFRDPYKGYESKDLKAKNDEYLRKLEDKGIKFDSNPEGIQRRLQLSKIKSISDYINNNVSNYLPNSVLISADIENLPDFSKKLDEYENKDIGWFDFPDEIVFSIIDGQHRLVGLAKAEPEILEEFEIIAVLLFNVSTPVAARLFSDINGKQKPVNRSLIYDLFGEMDSGHIDELKIYHSICQQFYTNPESPLYKQIKMLGIGFGAISQAFFIDYVSSAIRKTELTKIQDIYNQLFYYFKSYQVTFPEDWPVPVTFQNDEQLYQHAYEVLVVRKSQLVKTNGFGAIMKVFPEIYVQSNNEYKKYLQIIEKLKGNISWIIDPKQPTGTGKSYQNFLVDKIKSILFP